ncbi:MAG: AraC family transcriptional regulator [Bacillota bacterium]|nr:AraC family transcriptional regulator [Bacillota bacterium]
MEVVTVGRVYHKGYNLKLRYLKQKETCGDGSFGTCYKIILVEKGSGIVRINSSRYIFTAPCAFCLNELEDISFGDTGSISLRTICFQPEVINKVFNYSNVNQKPRQLSGLDFDDTYLLRIFTVRTSAYLGLLNIGPSSLKRIVSIFNLISLELEEQRDVDWPCRSRSFLFELLIVLQRIFLEGQPIDNIAVSEKYPEIAEIILYLHTNYMNKITVAEISRKFNINRTTLGTQFIEVTGLTVIAYLIKLRLDLAEMLLRDTLLPIAEIYERVGFSDRTHFGRTFSKHTGCTPSEYRKKYCWM